MGKIPAYVIISAVFFLAIGIGFAYSYFFYPNQHPIECVIKSYTGKDCPSCGFSRSFSHYTHLEIQQGKINNPLSWRVFLFFVAQLFLRAAVAMHYLRYRHAFSPPVIFSDAVISISLFLWAFLPIILKT